MAFTFCNSLLFILKFEVAATAPVRRNTSTEFIKLSFIISPDVPLKLANLSATELTGPVTRSLATLLLILNFH